tara:strand:- start:104 stop:838 length:735 start_codon:yes stop_codon:yes gene_type:complete
MSRLLVLQHIEREGPGLFTKVAKKFGLPVFVFRLDLGDNLPQIEKEDLLLILGGPMGLQDTNNPNYPWMLTELNLIREALDKEIRIIGVCLGAQLLAKAAGGDVTSILDSSSLKLLPEVGWGTILLERNFTKKIFKDAPMPVLDVLHWHGDRILLPSSARLIGSSKRCKEQFFQIGNFAYGMQFHIEVDGSMVKRWVEEDFEFIKLTLGPNAKQIILEQQKSYGDNSIDKRLYILKKLFQLIGF